MKVIKLAILLFLIPLLSSSAHKYYLSLTEMRYKSESKSLQIIINVFMDDIEEALNKDNNIDLQLTTKQELENNDIYFKQYLTKKLSFKVNGTEQYFNYIGKEYEGDLVFFYLEINNLDSINTIELTNNILMNHFPKQQNLIKSKVGKKHKSVLLTKNDTTAILKY